MLRQAFQQNAEDTTGPINMVGLGNDLLAAVSGAKPDNLEKAVQDAIAREMAAANNETLLGVSSGSIESSNRLELFNRQLRERLVKEAKKSGSYDAILLDLAAQRLELLDRLNTLNEYEDALNECMGILERGDPLPRNPDGSLQNADAEKAFKEYEEEHGVLLDRTNPESFSLVLDWIHHSQGKVLDELDTNAEKLNLTDATAKAEIVAAINETSSLDEQLIVNKAMSDLNAQQKLIGAQAVSSNDEDLGFTQEAAVAEADDFFTIGEFGSGDLSGIFSEKASLKTDDPFGPSQSVTKAPDFSPLDPK